MKDEIITATEASRSFSDVLHRVCYSGESFVIKKGNRLMARIVPVDASEVVAAKTAKVKEPAKSDSLAPKTKAAVPESAPAVVAKAAVEEAPYSDPNYYKTVLAEMDKLLTS